MRSRNPNHQIRETRDWARIVFAAGAAIAAIIKASTEVIRILA